MTPRVSDDHFLAWAPTDKGGSKNRGFRPSVLNITPNNIHNLC
jgi:hypothetical protein